MPDFALLDDLTLACGKTVAVERLTLGIRKGERVVLLGPSGCGKTTTMRAIAGLLAPRSGTIRLDGSDVTRVPPSRRVLGLVFQSYALSPHLTVHENVAFGLRLRRDPDLPSRVRSGLATVGLQDFAERAPAELSGGRQLRLAPARSLVMEPKLPLPHEPLSNLDARLRRAMCVELKRVRRETGLTMVFVTDAQSEALALADRTVVMRDGRIEQVGTPEEIHSRPATGFVADFVGFQTILPQPDGGALAGRPGAVSLGEGPDRGRVLRRRATRVRDRQRAWDGQGRCPGQRTPAGARPGGVLRPFAQPCRPA